MDFQKNKIKRGGKREGAGRKKIDAVTHTWQVPVDVHEIAKEKGTAYLWDAVRFKVKFDSYKKA
ncbi:MAG: hypothetical protein MJZ27_09865 [Bacteroidales bacterium]|nr:hypothetical protein [Bacteroidales bacterium]